MMLSRVTGGRRGFVGARFGLVASVTLLACGALAASAGATDVMIVTKGTAPSNPPKKAHYFKSI
jgi:hypothetical protein